VLQGCYGSVVGVLQRYQRVANWKLQESTGSICIYALRNIKQESGSAESIASRAASQGRTECSASNCCDRLETLSMVSPISCE
jgi:hypothetical protein